LPTADMLSYPLPPTRVMPYQEWIRGGERSHFMHAFDDDLGDLADVGAEPPPANAAQCEHCRETPCVTQLDEFEAMANTAVDNGDMDEVIASEGQVCHTVLLVPPPALLPAAASES